VKKVLSKKEVIRISFFAFFLSFFVISSVFAYQIVSPNEPITIGEFVYNDDYTPATTTCQIYIQNPSGSVVVNGQNMVTGTDGWQYYTFPTTTAEGVWPAHISCGSQISGDLIKMDKTFRVGYSSVSSTPIAASVWTSVNRTLTSAVSIADDIWNASTRSLTTFGSLVGDIWSDITAPVRRLTDKILTGGGSLATESYIDTATSTIIDEVLENRTLITALNNISAADVWSYGARTITGSVDVTTSSREAVWSVATSTLASLSGVGRLLVDNLDAQVSTRGTSNLTAADVWQAGTRSLTDYSTSSIALGVWSSAARTLTNYGNDITAADVWNVLSSSLTATGSIGRQLAENTTVSSTLLLSRIIENQSLISSLNNISAADVWSYGARTITGSVDVTTSSREAVWSVATSTLASLSGVGRLLVDNLDAQVSTRGTSNLTAADVWQAGTRSLTDYSTTSIASAIWSVPTGALTTVGSIGKQLGENVDIQISTRGTSNLTAADVWSAPTRSLTDYSTSTISAAVWSNAARTLTNYGNDITAADVWNVLSSSLTSVGSIGKQLADNTTVSTTRILDEILANRALINALNNISAADVWSYAGRTVSTTVEFTSSSIQDLWSVGVDTLTSFGSIGKLIVDNLDAQVSTRGTSNLTAADVWSAATRSLTDYSTSTISAAVWSNAARTLTNYGNDITAADVWNVLSSSLTTVGSIGKQLVDNVDVMLSTRASLVTQDALWTVRMSDVDSIAAGKTYRAKIFISNKETQPTNPVTAPTITIYDATRNTVVSGVAMTPVSTGVYEYTYSVPNGAEGGLWESVISSVVEVGKTLQTNDYWAVGSSPAQVLINTVSDTTIPTIAANVTITNEGLSGYEYQYEWCVVTSVENACGGNNDVYYASAAKFINPGEDFNTVLSATVPQAGNYFFKLVVYFGDESSSASRTFAATGTTPPTPPSGGGGGGAGFVPPLIQTNTSTNVTYKRADFNRDTKVNSVDFSILLAFWRTSPPFRNLYVDINADGRVDSVDFSILMYEWDAKK